MCLGDQDVVQNVGEIVASFALERLEEQQPGKVNDDWHTLEEGTLVSRDKEVLADEDRTKDKDKGMPHIQYQFAIQFVNSILPRRW